MRMWLHGMRATDIRIVLTRALPSMDSIGLQRRSIICSLLQRIRLTLFVAGLNLLGFMDPGLYTPITRDGWRLMPMRMK
jgi:hypothetical protein